MRYRPLLDILQRHQEMHRTILAVIMLALAFGASSAWADDNPCAANGRRHVDVDQDIEKVTVATDFDLAAINAMADKLGASVARPPQGFYLGRFLYTVDAKPAQVQEDCSSAVDIHVTLHLTKRVIEIGRELRAQPCRQSAEIEHYQRHAAADAAVIARYAALIRDHLTTEPIPPGDLNNWVKSIVEHDIKPLNDDRRAAQNGVNTPAEFARLDGACSV